ncbi:hypothetical protein F2P81_015900 [Scophthalmus maximus]|uniref:Uncharacterized protein n=1 Tax=Scophthalmus maximus TaxID=52904 RepID=A0A6A4SFJ2_SCOMX|nr:hypothetical protein F2P81_015900 [Scophthalmus maximus]
MALTSVFHSSSISIIMLTEHLVSCQVHKRARTRTYRSFERTPDCHPPQTRILTTNLQGTYQFTLTAKASEASVMNLPSRQKDSQVHLLMQQTCQADEPSGRPTRGLSKNRQTDGQTCQPTGTVGLTQSHVQFAYLEQDICAYRRHVRTDF